MELPEITEIKRWRVVHGDRLIVRVARLQTAEHATRIAEIIRSRLALADDFPILIIDESLVSLEVAES